MSTPPPGFVPVPAGPARLWVRAGLEATAPSLLAAWAGEAAEWIGGGRAAHPVVRLPDGGRAVVRRYRRGGAVRHVNPDRYFLGDRAAEEAAATEAARQAGARVPEVIAIGRAPARPGYRALLATRLVEGARDAAEALSASADRAGLLERMGDAAAALHAAGVAHPDLNLRNVLVDPAGEVWLIDFDRAERCPGAVPASLRTANLLRLARSAAKLGLPLSDEDWAALGRGYGGDWPIRR